MEKPFVAMADVASEAALLVQNEVARSGGWSFASVVPISSVGNADMIALRTHVHGLQSKKGK